MGRSPKKEGNFMAKEEQFLKIIKQAALDAVFDSSPCDFCIGVVVSESPLSIQLDQKLTLTEEFLLLTRNVTDYTITMEVDHTTEPEMGGSCGEHCREHSHDYIGEKEFIVKNHLTEGEKVILAKMAGGQMFIVWDRLGV